MMEALLLSSDSLPSKFGFGDGDMLDEFLYHIGIDPLRARPDQHLWFAHELLARCVERFLIPALPRPVRTYRIGTSHNPIRAEDEDFPLLPQPPVSVRVEWAEVRKLAEELDAEYAR